MPLTAKMTRCKPSHRRKEQRTPSSVGAKLPFPCLGASHGLQILTNENHRVKLRGVPRLMLAHPDDLPSAAFTGAVIDQS